MYSKSKVASYWDNVQSNSVYEQECFESIAKDYYEDAVKELAKELYEEGKFGDEYEDQTKSGFFDLKLSELYQEEVYFHLMTGEDYKKVDEDFFNHCYEVAEEKYNSSFCDWE